MSSAPPTAEVPAQPLSLSHLSINDVSTSTTDAFQASSHKDSRRMDHRSKQKGKDKGKNSEPKSQSKSNNTTRSSSRSQSHDVNLSKSLSFVLRHGATKLGINIRNDGFVKVEELLSHSKFRGYNLTDIQNVTENNEKKRFTMEQDESGVWWIRANQGHSLKEIDNVQMKEIQKAEEIPVLVHGTYTQRWNSIKKDGLKAMTRHHIHFATGLFGEDGVISGMRKNCEIFIYVDVEKAMSDRIKFYRSENGVILTAGVGEEKCLPVRYFKRVVDSEGQELDIGSHRSA
ncbi:KptA family-domain-containing protein [Paraphysoderma sedebokerense]|nr:KptA family-domain-containing protein [Paraphysoderma sedebokerense]